VGSAEPTQIAELEAESRTILGRLLAVMENYPDLKTQATVSDLMNAVKGVEDEIARQRYTCNNIAEQFNTMVDTIPSNIVARLCGLQNSSTLSLRKKLQKGLLFLFNFLQILTGFKDNSTICHDSYLPPTFRHHNSKRLGLLSYSCNRDVTGPKSF
jgi:hypothetical protein